MITISPTDRDRAKLAKLAPNAEEISNDFTDYTGLVVKKPWGKEWQVFANEDFSVWRLDLSAKSETSMHAHPNKTTILTVCDGWVLLETLDKKFTLNPGDVIVIERGAFHRSSTPHGAVLMEIECPNNKRDLVRAADRYGREGMGYETL